MKRYFPLLHHKMGLPSNGHTLLEICVVILLISGIAGFSMKLVVLPSSVLLRAEVEHLVSVLRYLQRKALLEQSGFTITFSEASYIADKPWQLQAGRFGTLAGIKGPPSAPGNKQPKGAALLKVTPERISAGTIYLTDGTVQYAISSDASAYNGIRVYRYDAGWKLVG